MSSYCQWTTISIKPEKPPTSQHLQDVQHALQSANEWSPPPPPAKSNIYQARKVKIFVTADVENHGPKEPDLKEKDK